MENKVSIAVFECMYIYISKTIYLLFYFYYFTFFFEWWLCFTFQFQRGVLVDAHIVVFPSCNQDIVSSPKFTNSKDQQEGKVKVQNFKSD